MSELRDALRALPRWDEDILLRFIEAREQSAREEAAAECNRVAALNRNYASAYGQGCYTYAAENLERCAAAIRKGPTPET